LMHFFSFALLNIVSPLLSTLFSFKECDRESFYSSVISSSSPLMGFNKDKCNQI
jgi:hypothetical protein